MHKKLIWIIGSVLALALVIFSCLFFIPHATPIDITLDAVKYDSTHGDANELGTVQIHVHGTLKEYLFRSDELELHIDDFDHLYDIRPWANPNPDGSYPGFKVDLSENSYEYGIVFGANSTITGEDSATLNLVLRKDLKKWEFFVGSSIYTDEALRNDPSLHIAYRATIE